MTTIPSDLVDLFDSDVAGLPSFGDEDGSPAAGAAAAGGASMMSGAYEGANRFDQLTLWAPALRSADGDLLGEKETLDGRARDVLRNDAYVSGGSTLHKDNIVGGLFLLNSKPRTRVLWGREDETWESEFQEEVETKFTLWAESPLCWPDASRRNTLTELVRLAIGVNTAAGETLVAADWMVGEDRPYRTAVQMIDTDRLSTPPQRQYDDKIRSGVERDRRGAPIAYHIRQAHPGDPGPMDKMFRWKRVPAYTRWNRPLILHLFEQMRPDQSRGVATMVSALTEMRMTKHFRKAELERAVLSATYAASIESDLPAAEVYAQMGAGDGAGSDQMLDAMADYLKAIEEYSGGAKNLHVNGSKIPVFMPGTHLKIQSPGANGPLGEQFEASLLRHIAASLGVSYEQLSRDYTKTNYSSARAAMGETWKHMQTRKKFVADRTANFIYRLWLEEAINLGDIESLRRRNIPSFYERLNAEAYCACEWIGAASVQMDPLKETQATLLQLRNGLTTKEREISRIHGADWRQEAKQQAREMAHDKSLGLPSVYETEPSEAERAASGSPQERES